MSNNFVETAISPDEYDIRERYVIFNRKYFGGKLPEDLTLGFRSLAAKKIMGVFEFYPNASGPVSWPRCSITLDTSYDYTAAGYDGILLHEMVHAYLIMVMDDQSMEQGGHHPRFWDLLNHVDGIARLDGIEMPSTESASIREFATARKRRQSMSIAVYRKKDDPDWLFRYAPMLPSVFDEIVNNFKFKFRTKVNTIGTNNKRKSTTDTHSGASAYPYMRNEPWFKTIDWETGVTVYRIEGGDLPFLLEAKGIKPSQRFLGRTYWGNDTNPNPPKIKDGDVPYNPEVLGIIKRALNRATGKCVVTDKGVLVNNELIHRAPDESATPAPQQNFATRTTKQGMVISRMAEREGLPINFTEITDPDDTFDGIVLDGKTSRLVSGELHHGIYKNSVCFFVRYSDVNTKDSYYNYRTAAAFFNMLPETVRQKMGMVVAEKTFELVTKSNWGVYSALRFTSFAHALEKALAIPKDTILRNCGNEVGDVHPDLLWGYIRKAIKDAHIDRLIKVYDQLGAMPWLEKRSGGVPLERIDADAFMEDVFGCGGSSVQFPIYFALIAHLTMLANTEPYKVLIEKTMAVNKIASYIGTDGYFDKLTEKLNAIGQTNDSFARIDAVSDRICQTFSMSVPAPLSYAPGSERDLDTKEKLRDNYIVGGGVFSRKRWQTVSNAIQVAIDSGTPQQKEVARDAQLQMASLEWYTSHVPDVNGTYEHIEVADFWNDLVSTEHITNLFKSSNDAYMLNNDVSNPEIRSVSVCLYLFGDLYSQMPTPYRDDAVAMWERIVDTAESGGNSIIGSAPEQPKAIVIPDLLEVVGGKPEAGDYTSKAYYQMTQDEKEQVLKDAGLVTSELEEFRSKDYGKKPLSELPEFYRQAFAGFKYLFGRGYVQPTRADVEASINPERREKLTILLRWENLYTNHGPAEENINLGNGSEWHSWQWWRAKLIQDYRIELAIDRAIINQNDRSMNFPLGSPEPALSSASGNGGLSDLEHNILMLFEDDPEWIVYPKDIRDANNGVIPVVVVDGLVSKGYLKDYDPVKFQLALTQKGLDWLLAQLKTTPDFEPDYNKELPPGWKEAYPGGMATNPDPVTGGIIDQNKQSGYWFIIFGNDRIPQADGFLMRRDAFKAFFAALAAAPEDKPAETKPEEKPTETKPEVKPEPEPEAKPIPPEASVKAPKVLVADGKEYFNLTIGVNEKTKKLMFVPVEQAKSNNLGRVRKREAKPVATFLSYVYADELDRITKKIKAGQRKGAARDLVHIANSIRGYLVATRDERTPFPGKLAPKVEADFGEGLTGQKAFWKLLQGKTTTRKKLYQDAAKLRQLAGIKEPDDKDIEEAEFYVNFELAATQDILRSGPSNVEVAAIEEAKTFADVGVRGNKFYLAITSRDINPEFFTQGILKGIKGVSSSKSIWIEWSPNAGRDMLLVMPADALMRANKITRVGYDDPDKLIANNCKALGRILSIRDVARDAGDNLIQNVFSYAGFNKVGYGYQGVANKAQFIAHDIRKGRAFDKPEVDMASFGDYQTQGLQLGSYDKWANLFYQAAKASGWEGREFIKFFSKQNRSKWLPMLKTGITKAASIYKSEAEWIVRNPDLDLRVPEGTHIIYAVDPRNVNPPEPRPITWMNYQEEGVKQAADTIAKLQTSKFSYKIVDALKTNEMLMKTRYKRPELAIDTSAGIKTFKHGKSTIEYCMDDDVVDLFSLRTPASSRGQGEAKQAMLAFLKETDHEGLTIKLLASPLDKKTKIDKLVTFYRSLGFVVTGKGNMAGEPTMERQPKAAIETAGSASMLLAIKNLRMSAKSVRLVFKDLVSGKYSRTKGPVIVNATGEQWQLMDGYHRMLQALLTGTTKIRAKRDINFSLHYAITKDDDIWVPNVKSATLGLELLGINTHDIESVRTALQSIGTETASSNRFGPIYHLTKSDLTSFSKFDIEKSAKSSVLGPAIYATYGDNSRWNAGHLREGRILSGYVTGRIFDLTQPAPREHLERISKLVGREVEVVPQLTLEKRFGSVAAGLKAAGFSAAIHFGPGNTGKHIAVFDPKYVVDDKVETAGFAAVVGHGPVIDNKEGLGNTPNHGDIDYRGMRVQMKPSKFLMLAESLQSKENSRMEKAVKEGEAIASPTLHIKVPDEWFDGDFSKPPKVTGHDGRHRMMAIRTIFGDKPIEVFLYLTGESQQFRAHKIDGKRDKWLKALDTKIIMQGANVAVINTLS